MAVAGAKNEAILATDEAGQSQDLAQSPETYSEAMALSEAPLTRDLADASYRERAAEVRDTFVPHYWSWDRG